MLGASSFEEPLSVIKYFRCKVLRTPLLALVISWERQTGLGANRIEPDVLKSRMSRNLFFSLATEYRSGRKHKDRWNVSTTKKQSL